MHHPDQRQNGFSIVEALISIGILSIIGAGVLTKVKSIKQNIQETSRIMSMDAMEASLGNFMRSKAVIQYSVDKAGLAALKNCFNLGPCTSGQGFSVPLYMEGQSDALTGPDVVYDESGTICKKSCKGYQILTTVRPNCNKQASCYGPAFVSIEADIRSTVDNKTIRHFAYDMQKYTGNTFPGLQLRCKDEQYVLRGIGMQGEPLCTPRSNLVLLDSKKKPVSTSVNITPKDCSAADVKAEDQNFVEGYKKDGQIICAERFW